MSSVWLLLYRQYMFSVCDSLVLYIYSAHSRLQVSLGVRHVGPMPDRHRATQAHPPSQQCHSGLVQCRAHCLVSICYLTASTHYNSGTLIPECNDLSQFKEDIGGPSVPVREINLVAYLPLVQPTENPRFDLDLNPGRQPARPSRYCGSESELAHWATETGTWVLCSVLLLCALPHNETVVFMLNI